MHSLLFVLGSVAPILLFAGQAFAFRHFRSETKLAADFVLLLIGAAVGGLLVDSATGLPVGGYHNPGVGVIYIPLLLVCLLCLGWWLARVTITIFRGSARAR